MRLGFCKKNKAHTRSAPGRIRCVWRRVCFVSVFASCLRSLVACARVRLGFCKKNKAHTRSVVFASYLLRAGRFTRSVDSRSLWSVFASCLRSLVKPHAWSSPIAAASSSHGAVLSAGSEPIASMPPLPLPLRTNSALAPVSPSAKDKFAGLDAYPVVIINWVQYLGPPGPSPSGFSGTFSRFSEDFLGRERGGGPYRGSSRTLGPPIQVTLQASGHVTY